MVVMMMKIEQRFDARGFSLTAKSQELAGNTGLTVEQNNGFVNASAVYGVRP